MNVPALRFPEFEGEWEQTRLGDGVDLLSGQHLGPDEYTDTISGDPYFTGPSDFTDDESQLTKWTLVEGKTATESDVLLTVKGNGVGELTILKLPKVAMGRQLMAVRGEGFASEIVAQVLLSRRNELQALASGNLIPGLSRPAILNLKVCFPSLPEQKKIAAFLGVVDAKIAALRARRAGLTRYKRGLMQALFSQTLRFTKPCGSAFPDWDSKPFSELVGLSRDRLNPTASSEKPPLIELENLESDLGAIVGMSDLVGQLSQKTRFRAGEVLFGKLRPYLRKFARPDFDGVCSSEIWVLRGKLLSNAFLFYLVQGSQFNQLANISAGSKMPRSDWKTVAESEFEFPHPDEQAKIAEALCAMDAKIAAVGDQVAQMEAFKKGLLQQMFV